ncbi:peptidylprolyl isomerase [Patescibacteria group bacterium]|nr:peptidylprolyl isomerase [Patescibacteria group bacterium]
MDGLDNKSKIVDPVVPRQPVSFKTIILMVLMIVVGVVVVATVLLYGFGSQNYFVKVMVGVLPFPMTIVENEVLYVSDYWNELDVSLKLCEEVGTNCQITDGDREEVYNNLLDEKVILVLAKRENVDVDDAKLAEVYQEIVDYNGGREKFLEVLGQNFGWSEEQFKKKVYVDLLPVELEDKLIEKVDAKHILIAVKEDATDEEKSVALDEVNEVVSKLKENVDDFGKLAREYSDDPSVEENEGDLGYFARGVMVPEFEKAVFSMKSGEISEPIKSDFGWHVILMVDRKGKISDSFENWLAVEKEKLRIWELYKV